MGFYEEIMWSISQKLINSFRDISMYFCTNFGTHFEYSFPVSEEKLKL